MQADKEVVLTAVRESACALRYVSAELQADKEVVLLAVKNNGYALRLASAKLKADKEVVLAAVQFGEIALQYVSDDIQIDTEFVIGVCRTLAGKKIQDYPLVYSWIQCLPSFHGKLALSLFTDATTTLDKLMEEETNRHMEMVDALIALSKDMTNQATLSKIDSFVGCLSAPSSLIGKHDRQKFETDF
jgi:hypothetical protein